MQRSAGGIILNDGKVALISERGRYFGFPKGHIEPGESDIETAKREIQEETGINQLNLIDELDSYTRQSFYPGNYKEIKLFVFKTEEVALMPNDFYNPEAKWVPISEVKDELHHQKDREFFEKNEAFISSL